ncbi:MAG: hypothetical protein SynsKO_38470 [Synoicihabitans sp.]
MTPHSIKDRIRACWLGKNIGGTLGCPFEGEPGPLDLDFYRPVPTEPLPNDDLDLQVVWLHHLLTGKHTTVTPDILAEAWEKHVEFPFDEYGVAKRNYAYGIKGIALGAFDNYFAECMGGAIRSEIWACIAPGDPKRAAGLAWADASVDHAAEGVYAEMFHAALQSAAFTIDDREALIDVGLEFVPKSSRLGQALRDTQSWWRESGDWMTVRGQILEKYDVGNFTDVVANLCFELVGWYAGEGDFGRSICIAVNCGLDTDCTGATLGALLGILDPSSIPQKWIEPIGENIVLSPEIVGVPVPRDIDELTEMTLRLGEQLAGFEAPIGEVLPAGPQQLPNEYVSIASALADTDEALPTNLDASDFDWKACTLHGHWLRWEESDFRGAHRLLKCPINLAESMPLKLLTGAPAGAQVWVDGVKVMGYSAEELALDPMAVPTLHRGGIATKIFANENLLAEGNHELVVALPRPAPGCWADLVICLGDPVTNLWLPWGLTPAGGRRILTQEQNTA